MTPDDSQIGRLAGRIRELEPGSRALLDLSVRRHLDDGEIASLLGTDAGYVKEARAHVMKTVAADLRLSPDELQQLEGMLGELPADAWLPVDVEPPSANGAPASPNGMRETAPVESPEGPGEPDPAPPQRPQPEAHAAEPEPAPAPVRPQPDAPAPAPERAKEAPVAGEPEPAKTDPVASEPEPAKTDPVAGEPEPAKTDPVAGEREPLKDEVPAERPAPSQGRRLGLVLTVGLLLLLGAGAAVVVVLRDDDDDAPAPMQPAGQPPAQTGQTGQTSPDADRLPDGMGRPLKVLGAEPGVNARARVRRGRAHVTVAGLRERRNAAYQAWAYDSVIEAKPLERLRPTENGRFRATFDADRARGFRFIDVSLERFDGNNSHSGRSLLRIRTRTIGIRAGGKPRGRRR